MDGAEHQLNRPLGDKALGLEGVGQAHAANHQVGAGGAQAIELAFDVLAFAELGGGRQQGQLLGHQQAIEVGGAHLHQLHAAFLLQEAGQGELQLGIGQQEQALASQHLPVGGDGAPAPLHQGVQHGSHRGRINAEGGSSSSHPGPAALHPQGVGAAHELGAPVHQGPGRAREEGLAKQHPGALAHRRQLGGTAGRQAAHQANAEALEQAGEPLFDAIGQGADEQELLFVAAGHQRHHRQQGVVFPLGEGGFNATAGVVEHHHPAGVLTAQPFRRLSQVELDHLTGAGAHQKQGANFRAPLEQIPHQAIQFFVGIGQAGQVPFPQDRRAEAGFGENHHPRGRLDQVGAGAGAHHQEEGIGHAPMQPNNRGEAAEHLPLAVLLDQVRPLKGAGGSWIGAGSSDPIARENRHGGR